MKGFPRSLIRDALPVALVGLVVFQALRQLCLERYLVPTDSMQPTLYGDAEHGDVVLVEKLSARFGTTPELHDLVVIRDPDQPERHMVKRVAALGDDPERCVLLLQDGDLWLGPDGQHLRRDVKDPLADRDLRVPWVRWPAPGAPVDPLESLAGPWQQLGEVLVLPEAAPTVQGLVAMLSPEARAERWATRPPRYRLPGHLSTARGVDGTYLDLNGERGGFQGRGKGVRDAGMQVVLEPGPGSTALTLVVQHYPEEWAWLYRADGRIELLRGGEPGGFSTSGPGLQVDRPIRLEFGFLDQHDFLAVDGVLLAHRRRPAAGDGNLAPTWPDTPRNLLMIGSAGGPVVLRSLEVFRDIFYFRERTPFAAGGPVRVPPGQVYLLGDNSYDSTDSRTRDPFPLDRLLGRPLMVLAPWSRHRWLSR